MQIPYVCSTSELWSKTGIPRNPFRRRERRGRRGRRGKKDRGNFFGGMFSQRMVRSTDLGKSWSVPYIFQCSRHTPMIPASTPTTGRINHYNYFRDYSPDIARYIQSDPMGLTGGINTYGYVRGDPLRFRDVLGLQAVPAPAPPAPPGGGAGPTSGGTQGGQVIPFPGPGGRERPSERPERPGSRSEPQQCPKPDPVCQFTGLATFESTGGYANVLSCQYQCPRKGIRYLSNTVYFESANPAYLCEPAVPEYYFP